MPHPNLQQYTARLGNKEVVERAKKFRSIMRNKSAEIFYLGSGFLVLSFKKRDNIEFIYDPSKVTIEFFTGKGETVVGGDSDIAHRVVIDSAFSKAQMKRQHRSPFYSGRYGIEILGIHAPKEVHFPLYQDDKCVVGHLMFNGNNSNLDSFVLNNFVPILEKTADIKDIYFLPSEGQIKRSSEAYLFFRFILAGRHMDYLEKIADGANQAFSLRQKAGEEAPYKPARIFYSTSH